jgi:tetratricopeptide (TPR) repeat protein
VSTPDEEALIEQACALHEAALGLQSQARLDEAQASCREALAIMEATLGPESPDTANVLNAMGGIERDLGQLAEAEACHRRALSIVERDVDVEPIQRIRRQALAGLGTALRMAGRHGDAQACLLRALDVAERWLPPGDAEIAMAHNDLGVLGKYAGRFEEAEAHYRQALAMVEATPGSEDFVATLLHNLAGLAHSRGDFAAAEPLARRSVEVRAGVAGVDHPATVADAAQHGAILLALGRLDEAEALLCDAIAWFERRLGEENYEVAVNLNNLAMLRIRQGRPSDAEALYRRSLRMKESLLGPGQPAPDGSPTDHQDVAMTAHNLAALLLERGRLDEAEAMASRAAASFASALDVGHPKLVAASELLTEIRAARP